MLSRCCGRQGSKVVLRAKYVLVLFDILVSWIPSLSLAMIPSRERSWMKEALKISIDELIGRRIAITHKKLMIETLQCRALRQLSVLASMLDMKTDTSKKSHRFYYLSYV